MISLPGTRPDPRSNLKKFQDANGPASKYECCPYGCGDAEMDELGYCEHLLGFTNANLPEGELKSKPTGADATVELLSVRPIKGQRCVTGETVPLKKGDFLVRITCSRRVYRETDAPKKPGEADITAEELANAAS